MERYIGIDVHAASCTVAIIAQAGKRLEDFPVETNGQALVEAIRRIPGRKHLGPWLRDYASGQRAAGRWGKGWIPLRDPHPGARLVALTCE